MMDTASQYLRQLLDCGSGKGLLSALIGFFASVLGGVGPLLGTLVALWAMDFFLGFMRAWSESTISVCKMRAGVVKALLYFATVLVMAIMDYALSQTISFIHIPVRDFVCVYLCLTESISCLGHLKYFGVPIPAWIATRLAGYRTAMDAGPSSSSGGSK
jgi:toxin secretion/phage lysis holin